MGVGIAHDLSQSALHGALHATGGQAGVLRGLQLQQRAAALADHRRLLDMGAQQGGRLVMWYVWRYKGYECDRLALLCCGVLWCGVLGGMGDGKRTHQPCCGLVLGHMGPVWIGVFARRQYRVEVTGAAGDRRVSERLKLLFTHTRHRKIR